jgi:hypothetical protein
VLIEPDVRAFGFAGTGNTFVIATGDSLSMYSRS